jgi:hypothetical protein
LHERCTECTQFWTGHRFHVLRLRGWLSCSIGLPAAVSSVASSSLDSTSYRFRTSSATRAGSPLQISVMRFLRPPTSNWLDYGRTAAQQREACCDSKGCNDCFQYLQGTPLNLRKCANRDSLGRLPPGPEDYEICTTVTIWMVTHELSVVFPRYLCAESHRRRVILHARSDQKCMQRV